MCTYILYIKERIVELYAIYLSYIPYIQKQNHSVVCNFYLNFFGPYWSYLTIFKTLPLELKDIYDKATIVESCLVKKILSSIYIHTYILMHVFVFVCTYIYIHICICIVYVYIHICMHVYIYIYVGIYIYVYTHTRTHAHTHTHTYIYIYIYTYTYIHTYTYNREMTQTYSTKMLNNIPIPT